MVLDNFHKKLTGNTRKNPKDKGGSGRVDDEDNNIPGEQEGNELNVTARNQSRNPDGTFKDENKSSGLLGADLAKDSESKSLFDSMPDKL